MLRQMEGLKSYAIVATDGEIGKVADLLFDDAEWTVRHVVVRTGSWLTGRSVLIAPQMVRAIDDGRREVQVNLTREQVEKAPSTDTDLPVSRQFETSYFDYYGLPYYWTGPYVWGEWMNPAAAEALAPTPEEAAALEERRKRMNPNLRSFNNVNGYKVEVSNGAMGDIEDMIIDDATWTIRYLLVDTRKFLPSKEVLVAPQSVREISWEKLSVFLDMNRDELNSRPAFNSIDDITDVEHMDVVIVDHPGG